MYMTEIEWLKCLRDIGALWCHDGDPKRPYVMLPCGRMTNAYLNWNFMVREHSELVPHAASDLAEKIHNEHVFRTNFPEFVVGPQTCGGTGFVEALASAFAADPIVIARMHNDHTCKAFNFTLDEQSRVARKKVMVSSVTARTLESVDAVIERLEEAHAIVMPAIATILNRSDEEWHRGHRIISLLNYPILTWDLGHNPFTTGMEVVAPLTPEDHWLELLGRDRVAA